MICSGLVANITRTGLQLMEQLLTQDQVREDRLCATQGHEWQKENRQKSVAIQYINQGRPGKTLWGRAAAYKSLTEHCTTGPEGRRSVTSNSCSHPQLVHNSPAPTNRYTLLDTGRPISAPAYLDALHALADFASIFTQAMRLELSHISEASQARHVLNHRLLLQEGRGHNVHIQCQPFLCGPQTLLVPQPHLQHV